MDTIGLTLYHVDYSGGTGGEKLAETSSNKYYSGDFLCRLESR